MRKITRHIVHCSDSTVGDVKAIRAWHKARNFRDVGYHFIIRRDGEIEIGRMLDETGAHTAGHNKDSIGTCLVGKNKFTPEQFESLRRLHRQLEKLFPNLEVIPHNKLNTGKTCPNFDVEQALFTRRH